MPELAIIGGSGLTTLKDLQITNREISHTPYGEPSGPLIRGELCGKEIVFLSRHGQNHTIPPHQVNYRANLWALKELGAKHVIAVAAVGGIRADMTPERLVFPDQIIDYTYSRAHTLYDTGLSNVTHIDFTWPYCSALRERLIQAAQAIGVDASTSATYGATQGPRLESAAEINRLERDGCDIVGMTGMPETAVARELELCYATCAVVGNWAAGRGSGTIALEEIDAHLKNGMVKVRALLEQVVISL